jgi:hypothetical protein
MRLLVVLLLPLVLATNAFADHLDPEQRIRAGDQARARAMLLRQSDLPGFQRRPSSGAEPHLTCPGLDESDLTVTGDAEAPTWSASVIFVTSSSTVYATRADAATSWSRGTSPAGARCLRQELGREFARQGVGVVSLRRVSFPSFAQRSAAYRLTLRGQSQGQTVDAYVDFVVLMQGRAVAGLVVGSALVRPDRPAEVRLATTIAARMAKAMRGARA